MENTLLYILLPASVYIAYLLFKKYYLPKIIGSIGEYYVARILKRLSKENYKVYNNIYIIQGGKTSQIDHLVLSVYGIFVIETKNYKGWIFGNEKSKYWTQTLYKKKNKIYNPVIQNWTHVNFLKGISPELKGLKYFPIVVFAGSAKLKKISSSTPVIRKRRLLRTIKRIRDVVLTHEQLAKIDGIINQSIVAGKNVKKEHKKQVRKNIKRTKKESNPSICPKCGERLLVKNGKFGKFLGCSNFPKCKFTKNIT